MRKHPCPIGPKPKGDQVLLLTGREMLEPVHTPPDAGELAAGEVLHQKVRRVSGVEGLLGREVALLRQGGLVEAVPIRFRLSASSHAAILTRGLVLCKRINLHRWFSLVPPVLHHGLL